MKAAVLACVVAAADAALLHRSQPMSDWSVRMETQGHEMHEVIIAVKQLNQDRLHEKLIDVSDPTSPNRYKYLSYDEAHALTANPAAVEQILKWLRENQVTISHQHKYGHYIQAVANVSTWERILETKFARVTAVTAGGNPEGVMRAVKDVSVPEHLVDAFEGIFKTTQLPLPTAPPLPLASPQLRSSQDDWVSPPKIAKYYDVFTPDGISSSSQSIFAAGQYFSKNDLSKFLSHYGISDSTQISEGGANHESDWRCRIDRNSCFEGNLDVQSMVGGAPGAATTFWYTPDENAAFESWILAVASNKNPPKVHSISYGAPEEQWDKSLMNTFNLEAAKLGAQGVSIFVSSGDDGVANNQARNDASKCGYHPSFPATSPYVTAVGATMGGVDEGASGLQEEQACSTPTSLITSGGGFSSYFAKGDWQKEAIASFFKNTPSTPVSGYNVSGRGYPDIAMAGNSYVVAVGSEFYSVSGTSASSPVVASFATLVNAGRLADGRPSIGFINPTLYSSPTAFKDITVGSNKCTASTVCCEQGFEETTGWSPITGLGSVNFEKFAALFDVSPSQSAVVV